MNSTIASSLWTSKTAAKATGGTSIVDWQASGVSINSRDIKPGDLFVAIKGPNFDGHNFVADALDSGASGAVIDHRPDGLGRNAPLLEVLDTTVALKDLGRAARQRASAKIIAVTGSVGKTGTKEALHLVLKDQGSCTASLGNFNNHWGVPLSLSRMSKNTTFGVFEIGMNHPGEITPLVKMVRPHIAVITNVELVHSEYFDSVEGIADAKAEIFTGLVDSGVCVLNRDNDQFERLQGAALSVGVKNVISFGTHAKAQTRSIKISKDSFGSDVDVIVGDKEFSYRINCPGQHWVINSLAVLATVYASGGNVSKAAKELENLRGLKGRGAIHSISFSGGSFNIIDESYNAAPVSMQAAFKVLGSMPIIGRGRRIAILGDMLELGEDSLAHHEAMVQLLIMERIDLIFTAGPNMRALFNALPQSMRGGSALTSQELLAEVLGFIQSGDVILIKGSAASGTSCIVEALLDMDNSNNSGSKNNKCSAIG